MSAFRSRRRARVALLGASVLLASMSAMILGGAAAQATTLPTALGADLRATAYCTTPDLDADGGVLLSAEVLGPDTDCEGATPAPSAPGTPGDSSGGGGGSVPQDASGPSDVAPAVDPPPAGDDEVALGGVLNVTGLQYRYTPSMNPAGGYIQLSLAVRNTSESTLDAETVFWVQTPFGNGAGRNVSVSIDKLKPGESRAVSATIDDVGQWAIYFAHATIVPPDEVDGVELSPLVRDATVFAFPWFSAILVVLVACSWWGAAALRRSSAASPVSVTA